MLIICTLAQGTVCWQARVPIYLWKDYTNKAKVWLWVFLIGKQVLVVLSSSYSVFYYSASKRFGKGAHCLWAHSTDAEMELRGEWELELGEKWALPASCPFPSASICLTGKQAQTFKQIGGSDFFCRCWHIDRTSLARCLGITGRSSPAWWERHATCCTLLSRGCWQTTARSQSRQDFKSTPTPTPFSHPLLPSLLLEAGWFTCYSNLHFGLAPLLGYI